MKKVNKNAWRQIYDMVLLKQGRGWRQMYDKDERVRFTFRLPATLLEKMKIIASIEGSSMNSLILHILWDYIKEIEK